MTDRQTDHGTPSVTTWRAYVHSTATQLKKQREDRHLWFCVHQQCWWKSLGLNSSSVETCTGAPCTSSDASDYPTIR